MRPHETFDFFSVRPFQRPKAPNIKRLELMRRMSRHIERNYVLFLTVELKIGRMVAFVAIKDKEPVGALRTTFCMEIEVFYPCEALLIRRPTIICKIDDPV